MKSAVMTWDDYAKDLEIKLQRAQSQLNSANEVIEAGMGYWSAYREVDFGKRNEARNAMFTALQKHQEVS